MDREVTGGRCCSESHDSPNQPRRMYYYLELSSPLTSRADNRAQRAGSNLRSCSSILCCCATRGLAFSNGILPWRFEVQVLLITRDQDLSVPCSRSYHSSFMSFQRSSLAYTIRYELSYKNMQTQLFHLCQTTFLSVLHFAVLPKYRFQS